MDAKVLYWTAALINMAVVVGLSVAGVAQVRAGNAERHRRLMLTAALLVVGFVVSYGFKLRLLGREDLSLWSTASIWTLRFHECCVLAMVVAGVLALHWGRGLRETRSFSRLPQDPIAPAPLLQRHQVAGRVAVTSAVLGLLSAGFVLIGMYARSSG